MTFKVLQVIHQDDKITKIRIEKNIYDGRIIEYLHYRGNYTFIEYRIYDAEVIDNDINGNEIGIININTINILDKQLIKSINKKIRKYDNNVNVDENYSIEDVRYIINELNISNNEKYYLEEDINYIFEKSKIKALLNSFGISNKESNNITDNIIKKYNMCSYNTILQKPYILFEFTDKFNVIEKMSSKENELLQLFNILDNMYKNNHTYILKNDLTLMNTIIRDNIENYLNILIKDELIITENDRVYIKKYYDMENTLDEMIRSRTFLKIKNKKILDNIDKFFETNDYHIKQFNKEQRLAIKNSVINEISLVTGGAGVGKTTTIYNGIIELYRYLDPDVKIQVVGFTGKSINKIKNKVVPAETIHKFLELPINHSFVNDEREEDINIDLLIIEEGGMIDIDLYYKLFKRLSQDTKIVIVGDYNQTESIGFGHVFKDLVNSNLVCKTELVKIYRQKNESSIVMNANKIISIDSGNNQMIIENNDFKVKDCNSKNIIDNIEKEIKTLINLGYNYDDIAILSPYRVGDNGCKNLNYKLSNIINKNRRYEFECEDKVIQNINNYKKCIYNGQQGIVVGIEIEACDLTQVDVLYGDEVVSYEGKEIDEIELAYSMTVHKMQGDECKVVIFIVDKGHKKMLNKNLIYTTVTRAKEKVIIIGEKDTFYEGIKKLPQHKNSGLLDRLCS